MIRVDRPLAVEGDPDGVPIPVTVSGGSGGGTSSDFGDPFPAAGTAAGFLDASGNMAGVELQADGSLPVAIVAGGGLTDAELRASPVPFSAISLPLPSGAATDAMLSAIGTVLGSPFQAGGSIGNASFASTVADGANVTLGAKADPKSTATDTTPISAMSVWKQISASVQLFVFGAGTAAAAQRTTLASDDPAVTTLGATTGTKVITDATGTIQQYLRGLIYLLITPLAAFVTIARKFIYGNIVTLTTTNFSGLTSTSGWQSDAISTGGAAEIQFLLETLGAAGSTLQVDFYLAEAFTSGSFTDSATGTEGTFTATGRKNSRYIGSLQLNTTSVVRGMLKVTDVSGSLPERVVLLGINNSGGTISATGGNTVFKYELIN